MEVNEKKLARQLIGVNKWGSTGSGTLLYCTGVGKSYTACIIINKILAKNPVAHIIIIVPSAELFKQWKVEINNSIENKDLIKNIEIYTIHLLVERQIKLDTTLLIIDEIHEYLTEERLKYLDKTNIQYKYILGLTATFDDKHNREIILDTICPVIDTIDEEEALREGYISKFIEYNIGIDLTDREREDYTKYTKIINDNLNKFGKGGLILAGLCLSGDKKNKNFAYCNMLASKHGWKKGIDTSIPQFKEIDNLWNPGKIIGYARLLITAIRDRKDILYSADNKLIIALEVIRKFDNLKTICFSQSTNFADRLGLEINKYFYEKENNANRCVIYHSKLETKIGTNPKTGKPMKFGKKRLKDLAIQNIRNGTASHISTASALDKGFDVKTIRLGITTSGTQNPTQYTQRGGRTKRVESYEEDITKLIVNIYVKNSKDFDWLKKRQVNANTSRIYWIDSVDEISYNPKKEDEVNINEL